MLLVTALVLGLKARSGPGGAREREKSRDGDKGLCKRQKRVCAREKREMREKRERQKRVREKEGERAEGEGETGESL